MAAPTTHGPVIYLMVLLGVQLTLQVKFYKRSSKIYFLIIRDLSGQ